MHASDFAGYEDLLVAHLPLVDRVVAFTTRRHRLNAADAEEFGAHVHLKLVENDYEILRKFQNRSSLRTYLTVVVQRLFLDYRIAQWGKWRPSTEAKRLGPTAVLLESMMVREGRSFDEACETLRTNFGVEAGPRELYDISVRLPVRMPRRLVGEEAIVDAPAPGVRADDLVEQTERGRTAARTNAALARCVARLDPQDQLIVRMRFDEGLAIADVARALGIDAKIMYRRLEQVLKRLRGWLEADGVRAEDLADVLGSGSSDWASLAGPAASGIRRERPSI